MHSVEGNGRQQVPKGLKRGIYYVHESSDLPLPPFFPFLSSLCKGVLRWYIVEFRICFSSVAQKQQSVT